MEPLEFEDTDSLIDHVADKYAAEAEQLDSAAPVEAEAASASSEEVAEEEPKETEAVEAKPEAVEEAPAPEPQVKVIEERRTLWDSTEYDALSSKYDEAEARLHAVTKLAERAIIELERNGITLDDDTIKHHEELHKRLLAEAKVKREERTKAKLNEKTEEQKVEEQRKEYARQVLKAAEPLLQDRPFLRDQNNPKVVEFWKAHVKPDPMAAKAILIQLDSEALIKMRPKQTPAKAAPSQLKQTTKPVVAKKKAFDFDETIDSFLASNGIRA